MNTAAQSLIVGKEVVCYCGRCKMDLGHTIVAMKGATPARVMCRTCKTEHGYKAKKGVKEPGQAPETSTRVAKPRATKAAKEEKTVPIELEWMQQLNASTRQRRDYAANEVFSAGDKVAHSAFGEGIVQKLIFPNKVEILFRGDLKVLIHAGKA